MRMPTSLIDRTALVAKALVVVAKEIDTTRILSPQTVHHMFRFYPLKMWSFAIVERWMRARVRLFEGWMHRQEIACPFCLVLSTEARVIISQDCASSRKHVYNIALPPPVQHTGRNSRSKLLRKRIAILFRPITICRHRLHRRAASGSTGARPLHLSFSHAEARFRLEAGTDVDDLFLTLRLALRFGPGRFLSVALRPTARRNEG
jgi:hypothetical protein